MPVSKYPGVINQGNKLVINPIAGSIHPFPFAVDTADTARKLMTNKMQKQIVKGIKGNHESDPLLNLQAVAESLGCTRQTVGRWVDDGKIPSVPMPNGFRKVRKSVVEKILNGN